MKYVLIAILLTASINANSQYSAGHALAMLDNGGHVSRSNSKVRNIELNIKAIQKKTGLTEMKIADMTEYTRESINDKCGAGTITNEKIISASIPLLSSSNNNYATYLYFVKSSFNC